VKRGRRPGRIEASWDGMNEVWRVPSMKKRELHCFPLVVFQTIMISGGQADHASSSDVQGCGKYPYG